MDPSSDPKQQEPSTECSGKDEGGPGATPEKVAGLVAELARAIGELEQAAPRSGAKALRQSIEGIPEDVRAILSRTLESDLRNALLLVLLSGGETEESASLEKVGRVNDQELVALVARLFRQFLSIEQAVVAISTEFMHEGQKVKLPRHFANLRGYVLQLIHHGGSDAVEKVNDYLGDINRWIAASLKAWEQAPDQWWTEWWRKVSPHTIEEAISIGPVGVLLGNKYHQFWKRYRELSQDLNPPDVRSQLLEIAGKIARETMEF